MGPGRLQVDAHRVGEYRWELFDRMGSSSLFRTDSRSVCDSPGRLLCIEFSREVDEQLLRVCCHLHDIFIIAVG